MKAAVGVGFIAACVLLSGYSVWRNHAKEVERKATLEKINRLYPPGGGIPPLRK